MSFHACTEEELDRFYKPRHSMRNRFEQLKSGALCLDRSEYYMIGSAEQETSSDIEVGLSRCVKEESGCKSKAEIDRVLMHGDI